MKSQWKKKQQEGERKEKKNAWQEFNEKTSKRQRTGFLSTKKESIFKSPDTVFGKVGVTGSGQGVTPSPIFKTTDVKRDSKQLKQEISKK